MFLCSLYYVTGLKALQRSPSLWRSLLFLHLDLDAVSLVVFAQGFNHFNIECSCPFQVAYLGGAEMGGDR